MNEDEKMVAAIRAKANELSTALSDAAEAGLTVEVTLTDWRTLSSPVSGTIINVKASRVTEVT